jgi:hypothetical protein
MLGRLAIIEFFGMRMDELRSYPAKMETTFGRVPIELS